MNVYIYQAALLCEDCGIKAREELTAAGKAPEDPGDENTYDSDDFPKGPVDDGGGEADCPQHCDECKVFLENPLTSDGVKYVRERVLTEDGDPAVLKEWLDFYWDCEIATDEELLIAKLGNALWWIDETINIEKTLEAIKTLPLTDDEVKPYLNEKMALEARSVRFATIVTRFNAAVEAYNKWLSSL